MKYKTERIEDLTSPTDSKKLLSELFLFVGENFDQDAQLRDTPQHFFRLWADQDPVNRLKIFTAREDEKIKGCVMAIITANPLFITKPNIYRFVNLTNEDKGFDEYVTTILNSI